MLTQIINQTTISLAIISVCLVFGCEDETTAGETTAGETAAGETTAGETTAGETTAGETTAGETTAGETTAGETADESYIPATLGPNDPPPERGRWAEYLPGGDTVCSRGGDYRFYVRGGDPDKVIVDFEGGGACWDAFTCSIADSIFKDSVRPIADFTSVIESGALDGLYADHGEDDPFKDWTLIHIPYCTGDIHWGDATQTYREDLTIEHKGFVNVQAVFSWLQSQFEAPSNLFVTGCSAGAYGAALHSAYLSELYPMSKMAVIADSGAGVITQDFLERSLPNWNAEANIPEWIEGLQRPAVELSLSEIYIEIANALPEARFSQYTSAFDADQRFYFTAMGGEPSQWNPQMTSSLASIESATDNFRSYIAPGPMHCIIPYGFMYDRVTETADGEVPFLEWMVDFVRGDLPDTATCTGESCYDDFVCEGCLNGSDTQRYCGFCQGWPDNARFEE